MLHDKQGSDVVRNDVAPYPATVARLFQRQLAIMSQQLDVLRVSCQPRARGHAPLTLLTREQTGGHNGQATGRTNHAAHNGKGGMSTRERSDHGVATDALEEQAAEISVLSLSEEQKELWFMSVAEDAASQAYNQSLRLSLRGPLQIAALQQALQGVVQRHEALRTIFDRTGAVQRILPTCPVALEYSDLSPLREAEREERIASLQKSEAQRLFDLEQGPLFHAYLITQGNNEHIFLFTIHHLIADGRSLGTLFNDLSALYAAACTGTPHQLRPATPYRSYLRQQVEREQSVEMEEAERYWLTRFADIPPTLEFPTDYQRPPVKTFHGARYRFRLARDLCQALQAFSLRQNCTLYVTLLAAYAAFLARITGQRDLVIPISSAGQFFIEGGESLVGHCVRLLPLRIVINGNPGLHDYVTMVKRTLIEGQEQQIYPFTRLVQKLMLPRDPSRIPLTATDFNLDVSGDLQLPGIEVDVQDNVMGFAQFDFSINITQVRDELLFEYSYNTDLFAQETIERWGGYFSTLLTRMTSDNARSFADLTLLSEKELQALVDSQQAVQHLYPIESSFIRLFEEQVVQTPDAIAVACEQEQLTYSTLDERASQMAGKLQGLGVSAGTLVVLLADRSNDFLTAIIAIFKAGGAYLPLNTRWPEKQYVHVLESSRARIVLTTVQYQSKVQTALQALQGEDTPQVYLLESLPGPEDEPRKRVLPTSRPGDLAYVIYTSGSTGVPKGAMVEQKGMLNHLFAKANELALTPQAVVAQNASQSFDISVWQFLASLLVGGRVQIIPDHLVNDHEALLEQVVRYNVSVLEIVPSLLQGFFLLTEETGARPPALPHLHWLISTGEALPPKLARQWLTAYPSIPIMNGYGPTECSDDVTHHVVAAPPDERAMLVPIGHPLANMELYVLDRDMQLVPPGIPGELYIGGIGVGRGYVHDPSTTAKTFVPHPFQQKPGNRLYKTGDSVRPGRDGNFEFLGRIDHQIKVRGFRIESGEIEACLYRHPAVRDVAVMVREDEPGEKRLVAYILATPEAIPASNQLRTWMREQIPEYMVPSAFVFLERFPLTHNGKLDTRALPAPTVDQVPESSPGVAPRNPTEALLVDIWKSVLRINEPGVHDNFFELGGDSIMSIKIIARLNDVGLKLTTREIFQYQTIAELANVVTRATGTGDTREEVTGQVPLTPIQISFFEELDLPNRHHYNQAVLLEVRERTDYHIFKQALRELLRRHDMLRARFLQREGGWECHIPDHQDELSFIYQDLSSLTTTAQKETLEAMAAELQTSLNISEGPLIRMACFDLGPSSRARLLIIVHHLVIDTISWQILLEDLQTACRQIQHGLRVQFPPRTTSFQSWAKHLALYAQSEALKQERAYWLALPWEQVQPVPRDDSQAANGRDALSIVASSLSHDETRRITRDVIRVHRCHINDVLLAALLQTYRRWTGQTALLLDVEGHGREEISDDMNATRTIGWFTSVAPVLLCAEGEQTAAQAIRAVKEQRQSIPHGGIGFGVLRALYRGEDRLPLLPRAQIGFNYLGQTTQETQEGALFEPALEDYGATVGKSGTLSYLIDIVCMVEHNALHIHWIYSAGVYRRETIERLASWYTAELRAMLVASNGVDTSLPPLYDASLMEIDAGTLDDLLLKVRFDNGQS